MTARVAVILAGLLCTLTACGTREEVVFSDTPSPDGAWTLRLTVAESRMPQGPFHVRAYLYAGDDPARATRLLDTTLANDGVPFTRTNLAVRWTDARAALLCLRATDRPDRGWRIETGDAPRAVAVDKC
ncbi:MAG: hypothetical protein H6977_10805 [Gammaproteobacteria bacterium]|nr:hypothetical protein [Gammaproteobacteria bacterium]MCP5200492.1 hypothetical protein [Gammaproteobacteria bacterium]